MKVTNLILTTFLLLLSAFAFADTFPKSPDLNLTPGSTCSEPDKFRYPERIPYCNRLVDVELKKQVIRDYNKKLGYQIYSRGDYKIDHFIPLCMGGSNHQDNLWPQHRSVSKVTDILEFMACQKMQEGKLTQKMAIEMLRAAKLDLSKASLIERQIHAL